MIRRLHITLRASEALVALTTLHASPLDHAVAAAGSSAAAAVFGARFGLDVARAFEAHARALDVFGQCLDWLERRDLCHVDRPRSRAGVRQPTWLSPAEVRVDVRALARDVTAEADDADSKARASAWALRLVLRHLAGTRQHTSETRSGNERVPALEALAAFDAVMATAGFGAQAAPPARLAHLASRTRRKDEPATTTHTPAAPAVTPAVTPARPSTTPAARPPAPAAKVTKPTTKEAPADAATTTTKRTTTKARPKPTAGFGGLPDDAVPEDRRTGDVYGPRGLTTDAEFFLTEAGIAAWPCDGAVLERGRRAVVSKLHPDRAGESSTTAFHRAIKGHAELAKRLSVVSVSATATTSVTVTTTTSVTATATTSTTASQPTSAPVAAVATAPSTDAATTPRTRRARPKPDRSQSEPSVAAAPAPSPATPPTSSATASRVESTRATTFEWPPRPAEPPHAVTPPAPPRAPSQRRARSA